MDDPIYSPAAAAAYCGRAPRTLRKLKLKRDPMPGEGNEWGYRRSTLNRYMRELEAERSHLLPDDDSLNGQEQSSVLAP